MIAFVAWAIYCPGSTFSPCADAEPDSSSNNVTSHITVCNCRVAAKNSPAPPVISFLTQLKVSSRVSSSLSACSQVRGQKNSASCWVAEIARKVHRGVRANWDHRFRPPPLAVRPDLGKELPQVRLRAWSLASSGRSASETPAATRSIRARVLLRILRKFRGKHVALHHAERRVKRKLSGDVVDYRV